MKNAIIFDIDGTLSDLSHRRHFVTNGNKDWDSFFDGMGDDKPTGVVALAELLASYRETLLAAGYPAEGVFSLFSFTGRPDNYRAMTLAWLEKYTPTFIRQADLYMRPAGDFRPDTEIKREMLNKIRADGFTPLFVVDDRPSVIAMWKSEGLTVLEHDSGEWDSKPAKGTPGKLTLMVGPSGSGKSTYVFANYPNEMVVCSDDIRMEIGAFNDMTKNRQVFAAVHAMTKARIDNGLDVVVDATNLHARDRRAIRDLVPENCKIVYVVINRSLEVKAKDGGWRNDVVVDGMPLIQYHDIKFKSGIRHIMAGDRDPRVTVIDRRT